VHFYFLPFLFHSTIVVAFARGMPIYEEKLISPFAVHFTQQRIRKTFQDGHEVEATIKQITAKPGVGEYDIILNTPFPAIEIMRWSPKRRRAGGKHWCSFDNHRLYCLQRVAAAYWPKRVATAVEVFDADSGSIKKKLDLATNGLSVSIGHAQWAWQQAVKERAPPGNFALNAEAAVAADAAKAKVGDLEDAPAVLNIPGNCSMPPGLECDTKPCSSPPPGLIPPLGLGFEPNCCAVPTPKFESNKPAKFLLQSSKAVVIVQQEAVAPESSCMTNLIGQLIDYKPKEHSDLQEDSRSTHIPSEGTDSITLSDVAASESPTLSPSIPQETCQMLPLRDEESDHSAAAPNAKEARHLRRAKEARMQQQLREAQLATEAAKMHLAKCQRAQYQWAAQHAAQYQAAQMAQWQQAQVYQYQVAHMQAAARAGYY